MIRRLFALAVASLFLLPQVFAQTGLVVSETFHYGGMDASVLPGVMADYSVIATQANVRLLPNLGVAIVNPNALPVNVIFAIRNGLTGAITSTKTITVPGHFHTSRFINQFFSDVAALPVDFNGTVSIASTSPVAITALRYNGTMFSAIPIVNLLSSAPIPLIPVSASANNGIAGNAGGPESVILPQFVVGGGWATDIGLTNYTATVKTLRVDLFQDNGMPLVVSTGSTFPHIVLLPGAALTLAFNDKNPIEIGYAVVTPVLPPEPDPAEPPDVLPPPIVTPPVVVILPHAGPAQVALGPAAPYGILAGAGVTNSGPTIIHGSLGTSPTGTLTGAPTVTGTTDLANPASAAAKLALTVAFNDAASRSLSSISLPGDLSGLTLAPGLYTNSTSVILSAGNVTLDAGGNPDSTWIFQMGSTLTTISGTQIVLAGGAKASNIFWEVGSSATLGTASIFKGNILAAISISVNTGAVIEGRLLTETGAVSLLSNTVTVP